MKKLIPALCMLLVAAALLGTSTFAWFSMNKTVTATGMQVTAKSDSVFLLIGSGDDDTVSEIQSAGTLTTALTVDSSEAQVYPAAHDTFTTAADALATDISHDTGYYYLTGSPTTKITADAWALLGTDDQANYIKETVIASNWYYKIADAPTASASTKDATYLTGLTGYVVHKTCYVTLAAGSNTATNLQVTGMTITSNGTAAGSGATFAPVKVVVASASAVVELDSTTTSSTTPLAATVTDSGVVKLDIFIYYNGAHDSVYTANVTNLDGANISLSFGVN